MRIRAIYEQSVRLQGNIANAVVDFSNHTVSLLAIVSDQQRHGRPVAGLAFNSIGRFAQSGILHERMIPRLLDCDPETLLAADGGGLDPAGIARTAMQDEKPGGHGDRAGAVAVLELAAWDLNAKLADEPACTHIRRSLGTARALPPANQGAHVYAAGGYYYPDDSVERLRDELQRYIDDGFEAFKIKIGGASLEEDLTRIEAAIEVAGDARKLAVDANGRFDTATALRYGNAIQDYGLSWYEEPGDPLDYALLAEVASQFEGCLATGENLFSAQDTDNLIRYAGLRPGRDRLQMDPGLSYGLTEYLRMLEVVENAGFDRSQCIPHGGHLINLHIVSALGLGGCEAYPGVFQPFGGYAPDCRVEDGRVWPGEAPGFGLEQKPELKPHIDTMLES